MGSNLPLVVAFGLGVVSGLRSMTGIAVLTWFARSNALPLQGTSLAFLGSTGAAIVFTLAALAELVADKLPKTPSRKQAPGLIARLAMGALAGAAVARAGGCSLPAGIALGALGALAGTFGGYWARTRSVAALRTRDFPVALAEDAVAVGGALLLLSLL